MTSDERDSLIVSYLPLANKLAWKKKKTVPSHISIDELKSAAYMGLVDAASKFCPEQGSFGSYAAIRILGEIKDYLRQLGRFPSTSLDQKEDEDQVSISETIPAVKERDPWEFFEDVTKTLNDVGKNVVTSYYINNLSLREIGATMSVGESRVSQILSSCKDSIKDNWSEAEFREAI